MIYVLSKKIDENLQVNVAKVSEVEQKNNFQCSTQTGKCNRGGSRPEKVPSS